MTVPDPLLRFVPTPEGTALTLAGANVRVQSNDAALTRTLTTFLADHISHPCISCLREVKFVREETERCDGTTLLYLHAGAVTTLLCGTTTSLFLDVERGELLGFVAADLSCEALAARFLPALIQESTCHVLHSESCQ